MAKVTASVALDFHIAAAIDVLVKERGLDSRSAVMQEILAIYLQDCRRYQDPIADLPWQDVTANGAISARRYYRIDAGLGRVARLEYDGKHSLYYPSLTLEEDGREVARETLNVSPHEYAVYLASAKVIQRWPDVDPANAPQVGLWTVGLTQLHRETVR